MRWVGLEARSGARILGAVALVALLAMFVAGSATAAGNKKVVEGTVFDTTCAGVACGVECPPPPHCGPITADGTNSAIVCPLQERRKIACPLSRASVIVCVRAEGCPGTTDPPVYSGEGAVVNVRKRGSAKLIATLAVTEGHFSVRLAPGEYVLRPYLPEPQCWSGEPTTITVAAKAKGPIPASLDVSNSCVAHPDAAAR
jgi:hypothetical protein